MNALLDTCILIDYLNGIAAARAELMLYQGKHISAITWMEVLVGATPDTEPATRHFLEGFHLLETDHAVREEAVTLRRTHRLKLPDAIIWASARIHALPLVTRNTKDFSDTPPLIRIPYRLA
ncbi:MAG: type II toxin-antitoxin system VapC family toxin [Methylococcales bacterium]